jgi:hypothetical protein
VSDEDTFAWKLQSEFPSLSIGNFGVGGYGSYQSLLMLRGLYAHNYRPAMVVYGFLPFHEDRNIANAGWLRVLSEHSKRGHSYLPFCSLDNNGELKENSPVEYPVLPLRQHLALVDFAAKSYFKFLDQDERKRRSDGFEITKKLMLEMDRLAKANGSIFAVAIFGQPIIYGSYPQQYKSFFKESGIQTIDCLFDLDEDYIVQGDGHPNEKVHSIWAERIATFFKAKLFWKTTAPAVKYSSAT